MPNHGHGDYQQAREALGARFRQLRKHAGLTGKQLAEGLGWSQPKVSRIERGQRTPSEDDLLAFAQVVGASAEIADELLARLRTVHAAYAAWRRQLGAHNGRYDAAAIEGGARMMRAFEPWAIPGMLQTADYARRALAEVGMLHGLPDEVEEAVRLRMRRQQLLYDPGRRFEFVIGEPALRSQSCPPPVMRAQLDLVRALSNLETLEVCVLPVAARLPFAPLYGFWMFDEELVSVETLATEVQVRDPHEIALYIRVFDRLKAAARVGETARELLTRIIEDWRRLEDEPHRSPVMNDRITG